MRPFDDRLGLALHGLGGVARRSALPARAATSSACSAVDSCRCRLALHPPALLPPDAWADSLANVEVDEEWLARVLGGRGRGEAGGAAAAAAGEAPDMSAEEIRERKRRQGRWARGVQKGCFDRHSWVVCWRSVLCTGDSMHTASAPSHRDRQIPHRL